MDLPETSCTAPSAGTVAEILVASGDQIDAGATVARLEVMKMEVDVTSEHSGVVIEVMVRPGEHLAEGDQVLRIKAGNAGGDSSDPRTADFESAEDRSDLAEVLDRRARRLDRARPEAISKRHSRGGRSARENLEDLVDRDSFVEYGGLALAAQRGRRSEEELIESTAADGLIGGTAQVNGELFGEDGRCAVVSYDYTVLAGTQGATGHFKKDRLFELIERMRLPVVLFAEGGGGRPGDTDYATGSSLTARAFALWGRLSGLVPRIAIVHGRCFAGNAALAGSADLLVATEGSNIGMGGPAMIAGGGLGVHEPEAIGPIEVQSANGVVDVRVADEAEAVAVAKQLLSYFQGRVADWTEPDQAPLRAIVPENRRRVYDPIEVVTTLADAGSVTELRAEFAPGMFTALARIEGRPVGVFGNDCRHLAGAITSTGADKAARFMALCEAFDIPLISLVDTPGMMVGPEAEESALVRHCSRLFAVGPNLTVPLLAVVLRRGYGLGAQAMVGGSFQEPLISLAWPGGEMGPMGIEGAVELGMKRELEAITDPDERDARFRELVAGLEHHFRAVNVATFFEIDDVIDPIDTRGILAKTLAAAPPAEPRQGKKLAWVDTW